MPVIPNSVEAEDWLKGDDNPDIGSSIELHGYPVHKFGVHDEGEELIEPMETF